MSESLARTVSRATRAVKGREASMENVSMYLNGVFSLSENFAGAERDAETVGASGGVDRIENKRAEQSGTMIHGMGVGDGVGGEP
jgi:hypothetical protein